MKLFKLLISILPIILFSCSNNDDEIWYQYSTNGKLYGYLYNDGQIAIKEQFESLGRFSEDLASFSLGGKLGYINRKGEIVINAKYSYAGNFNNDIAWVIENDSTCPIAINKDGKELFRVPFAENVQDYSEKLSIFTSNQTDSKGLVGAIDNNGKIVIKPQYQSIKEFVNGLAVVVDKNNKYGIINKDNKIIIPFEYDDLLTDNSDNQLFIIKIAEKCGVIDLENKFIINPHFQTIDFDGDKFLVCLNDKYGWIDKHGKVLIKPQFEYCGKFGNYTSATISLNSKLGLINDKGKIIVNPQYSGCDYHIGSAQKTSELICFRENNLHGYFNNEGKIIIKPQFEMSSEFYQNTAIVHDVKMINMD